MICRPRCVNSTNWINCCRRSLELCRVSSATRRTSSEPWEDWGPASTTAMPRPWPWRRPRSSSTSWSASCRGSISCWPRTQRYPRCLVEVFCIPCPPACYLSAWASHVAYVTNQKLIFKSRIEHRKITSQIKIGNIILNCKPKRLLSPFLNHFLLSKLNHLNYFFPLAYSTLQLKSRRFICAR